MKYQEKPVSKRFKETKNLFFENKTTIFKIAGVLAIIQLSIDFIMNYIVKVSTSTVEESDLIVQNIGIIFGSSFAFQVLLGIISFIVLWGFAFKIYKNLNGENCLFKEGTKKTLKKLFPFIFATVLYSMAIFFLSLLLIVPGIIFMIYWTFYSYSIIFKDKSITESFSYSKQLVKNNWWRVLGNLGYLTAVIFILSILAFLIGFIIGIFRPLIPDIIIMFESLPFYFYNYLLTYLSVIFGVILFRDLEIEKGFFNNSQENGNQTTISQKENQIKNYINQYKSQYSRESIKIALLNSGLNESDIDTYLNKYF